VTFVYCHSCVCFFKSFSSELKRIRIIYLHNYLSSGYSKSVLEMSVRILLSDFHFTVLVLARAFYNRCSIGFKLLPKLFTSLTFCCSHMSCFISFLDLFTTVFTFDKYRISFVLAFLASMLSPALVSAIQCKFSRAFYFTTFRTCSRHFVELLYT
jgi:hypothetical protein